MLLFEYGSPAPYELLEAKKGYDAKPAPSRVGCVCVAPDLSVHGSRRAVPPRQAAAVDAQHFLLGILDRAMTCDQRALKHDCREITRGRYCDIDDQLALECRGAKQRHALAIALATREFHASNRACVSTSGCPSAKTASATIPARLNSSHRSDGGPTLIAATCDGRTNRMVGNGTVGARRVRSRWISNGAAISASPQSAAG